MVETVEPFAFWLRACVYTRARLCTGKLRSFSKTTSGLKPGVLSPALSLSGFTGKKLDGG